MDGNSKIDEDLQPSYVLNDAGVPDHARVEHGASPQRQPCLLTLLPSLLQNLQRPLFLTGRHLRHPVCSVPRRFVW